MAPNTRRPGWLGAPSQALESYGEALIKGRQVPDPREAHRSFYAGGPASGCGTDPGVKLAVSLAIVGIALGLVSLAFAIWRVL